MVTNTTERNHAYDVSPKDAAIAVEQFLNDCGYVMDGLKMIEAAGGKLGRYSFDDL